MDAEVREDLTKVVKAGNAHAIEEKMLDYVVKDERTNLLRRADQKRASKDKKTINRGTYLVSLIPIAIALYCVFSIVFTGKIVLPW
jgi:23S rRNA maturation mini-RNase III